MSYAGKPDINADIYGIYQSKRMPASDKLKCSV